MARECECTKWEENLYWSKFEKVQFVQILSGRFDLELPIPTKFTSNVRDKLTGTVSFRGPSGFTWDVEILSNGDTLLLKKGWDVFVSDHSLEEKDILIFKYFGKSKFEVSIFHNENFCERESSFFVKRCCPLKNDCKGKQKGSEEKRNEPSESETEPEQENEKTKVNTKSTSSRRRPGRPKSTGQKKILRGEQGSCSAPNIELELENQEEAAAVALNNDCRGKQKSYEFSESESSESSESSGNDSEYTQRERKKRKVTAKSASSRRRPGRPKSTSRKQSLRGELGSSSSLLIDLEEENQEDALENSLKIVITSSHLNEMTLPSDWIKKYHLDKNVAVELRIGENIWKAEYQYGGYEGKLAGGWKTFFLENKLKNADVCFFNFVSLNPETLTLEVKIAQEREAEAMETLNLLHTNPRG